MRRNTSLSPGLNRQIDVLAQAREISDGADDAIGHVFRMRREKTHALDAVDGIDGCQEVGQIRLPGRSCPYALTVCPSSVTSW